MTPGTVFSQIASCIKRESKTSQSYILDSTPWIPDSRYWIPVLFQWNLDSWFHSLLGFRTPWAVFQIPKTRILDSTSENFSDSRFCKKKCPVFAPDSAIWVPLGYIHYEYHRREKGNGGIVKISEGRKRGCQFFLKQLINHFTRELSYFLVQWRMVLLLYCTKLQCPLLCAVTSQLNIFLHQSYSFSSPAFFLAFSLFVFFSLGLVLC